MQALHSGQVGFPLSHVLMPSALKMWPHCITLIISTAVLPEEFITSGSP